MNTPLYCVSRFRNVRRHHRYLMGKDPSLAPAVFGGGMVLPNGAVALPLSRRIYRRLRGPRRRPILLPLRAKPRLGSRNGAQRGR